MEKRWTRGSMQSSCDITQARRGHWGKDVLEALVPSCLNMMPLQVSLTFPGSLMCCLSNNRLNNCPSPEDMALFYNTNSGQFTLIHCDSNFFPLRNKNGSKKANISRLAYQDVFGAFFDNSLTFQKNPEDCRRLPKNNVHV